MKNLFALIGFMTTCAVCSGIITYIVVTHERLYELYVNWVIKVVRRIVDGL